MHYQRAVDHEGEARESLATKIRDKPAVLKQMKRLMKRYSKPKTIVTDGLRYYGAAMKEIDNAGCQEGALAQRSAENPHQPFRRRAGYTVVSEKFAAVHRAAHNHFNQERSSAEIPTENTLSRTGRGAGGPGLGPA